MTQAVLIVGAGPVGLTLGIELTRYGVPVRIVDRADQRADESKALVIWSRTLELLDRQPGGATPFIEAGFKANAVSILSGGRLIGRVTTDTVASPYPYALMIPQPETERLLEERLYSLGVKVERAVEVTSFEQREDGVDAVLRHAHGHEERTSADWLAGCDGAHSLVRHNAGATFAGDTMDSDWILADVHMHGYPVPDNEASVFWDKAGAFIAFPISPGRYRLLADVPPSGSAQPLAPTIDQVQAIVDERGPRGVTVLNPIWLAGFRINSRKVSSYRWGRAFLCGDAAHVHSPAGGQGMNTGMQDSFNLGWKLAAVAHGCASEALLDSYSTERSAVGDQELANTQRLTKAATLRNPVARVVRNALGHLLLGLSPIQHAVAENMTEISIGYPNSPLNVGSAHGLGGPLPGQRFVADRPFGADHLPKFALLAKGDDEAKLILQPYADLLETDLRHPPDDQGIWLVRPDGYIAAVAHAGNWKPIEECLSRLRP
jgi:2-polyprenyl-6-methoxyphenol hydroxylase-like FAD-dependent oxidoreductase